MATNKWQCTYCNAKKVRPVTQGRPDPGKCPKKQGDKPHSWVKNN